MQYRKVDLYEAFSIAKPEGACGILTCMIPDVTPKVNLNRRYPALLILPGGAYAYTSEREAEPVAFHFLSAGFACFILDYSAAPARFPTAFREAALAVRFIRENAEAMHAAPDKVAALGFSAGGHLCGCLATLCADACVSDLCGGDPARIRPDAVLLGYPVITSIGPSHALSFENLTGGDAALTKTLSLETRVTAESVPAFIWHTAADASVPVASSLLFASAYAAHGVPFSLHIYERGIHGLATVDSYAFHTDKFPDCSADAADWMKLGVRWLAERGIRAEDET